MASLSTHFTVGATFLVLYLVAMIAFYRPSPLALSETGSSKGERVRLQEDLLLSAARKEGMAAGRRGGGVGMANDKSASSKSHECQEMFTLDKRGELWVDDGPYTEVSLQLPSLLINWKSGANSASASLATSTRLAMLDGSVPYLPCKIRQFDPNDLGSCVASRSHQGRKTWIAFVSDSNGRLKLHSFLSFLPPGLHYTFFLGYQEVSFETFLVSVAHHRHRPLTFDIVGHRNEGKGNLSEGKVPPHLPFPSPDQDVFSLFNETENPKAFNFSLFTLRESDVPPDYDLRVSLVWAPLGSEANAAMLQDRIKVNKIDEWAGLEVIPDVIIVGFGTWMLLARKEMDEVGVFAESERLARPLVAPLTKLAKRTTVLWWHQSRYRGFNDERRIDIDHPDANKYWEKLLHMNTFSDSIPFMDAWIWETSLKNTGMWQWDSTVPFNLANLRECHQLKQSGVNDNVYKGKWWNCEDEHHSSYETNIVEIQMLLNLLCNPFLNSTEPYCCSNI